MTMLEHTLLGNAILMLLWFVGIRHLFTTPENEKDIENEIKKLF